MITLIKNTENSKQQLFPFHVDKNNSNEESALFANLLGMAKKTVDNESNASNENREAAEKGNLFKSVESQKQENKDTDNIASDDNGTSVNLNENLPAPGEQIGLNLVMPENTGAEKHGADSNEMITGIILQDGKIIKNIVFTASSAASGDLPSANTNSVDNSNLTVAVKEVNADKLNSENIIFANGKGISVSELEKLGFQKLTDQSSLVDTELKKIEAQIQTLINKSLAKDDNINLNEQISSANTAKNQNTSENIDQEIKQNSNQETQTDGKNIYHQQATIKPGNAQFSESVIAKDNLESGINYKNSQSGETGTEILNKSALGQKSGDIQTNNQSTKNDMQNADDKSFQNQQNNPVSDKAANLENETIAQVNKSNQNSSAENSSVNHTTAKPNDAELTMAFSKEETNLKEKLGENIATGRNNGNENNKEAGFNDTQLKNSESVFGNKNIKGSEVNTHSDQAQNTSSTTIGKEENKVNSSGVNSRNQVSNETIRAEQNTGKSSANINENNSSKTNQFANDQINIKQINDNKARNESPDISENSQQAAKNESKGQIKETFFKSSSLKANQNTNEHVKTQDNSGTFVTKSAEANTTKTIATENPSVQDKDISKDPNLNISNPEPAKAAIKNNQQQTTTAKVDSESFQVSNKNNQSANTDNSNALKNSFNRDIAENKFQFTNNKPTIESGNMNIDKTEKTANTNPENTFIGLNNTNKNSNKNHKTDGLDNRELKPTIQTNSMKSEKDDNFSATTEIKSKKVNTDNFNGESRTINQNQATTKSGPAMASNTEQESKKVTADLFNAESRTVNQNQTNLKNEVKQSSEQIITTESNTKQDSNPDFSQSSRDSYGNNDANETVHNKFTPEKKSDRNDSFADKVSQKDEEKQNKINPLAEANPTQKIQTPTPETRPLGYTDIRGVIQKIERMVTEASQNKLNNTSFSLDSKDFGKMEIRIRQNSKEDQGVILVENQTIKEQIQKFIPDIQENLNQKGAMISAINVEVNSQNENTDPQSRFSGKKNNRKVDSTNNNYASASEIDTRTTKTRSYGYNTMEVLA
ncbi:MAG: flagellar hook-length control protein FliK [Fidelibacterota bacterium]